MPLQNAIWGVLLIWASAAPLALIPSNWSGPDAIIRALNWLYGALLGTATIAVATARRMINLLGFLVARYRCGPQTRSQSQFEVACPDSMLPRKGFTQ